MNPFTDSPQLCKNIRRTKKNYSEDRQKLLAIIPGYN